MSLRPTLRLSAVCLLATIVVAISGITNQASAQTSIVLYQFGSNTGDPLSPMYPAVLTQGRDGSLYSTAPKGGANGNGAAYRISPSGTFSVVHSFLADKSEGTNCLSGLNMGRDGNFYGVCQASLSALEGTAYSLNASGTFKLVHAFLGSPNDGGWVYGAPIQALDNTFYGATWNGGAGGGLAYKTDASGSGYKVIYDFGKAPGDAFAIYSSFVQGSDKYLYVGAASGAIVKLSTAGKETVLYTLNDPSRGDGLNLLAGLIQGSDGYFYGCTQMGGIYGYGTVFKVSSKGSFTVLRRFGAIGSADGLNCNTALIQATDGNYYGVQPNRLGGSDHGGVIFKLDPQGTYSVVNSFQGTPAAISPVSPLYQHTNGLLYGVTQNGGLGHGFVFSFDIGAKPFARLELASGVAGDSIGIFGQGFLTATGVTFGGVPASFATAGDNYLTVTVPSGGKSGSVVVQMPGGNLTSSQLFKIVPTITSFTPSQGPVGTVVTITGTGLVQTSHVTFGGVAATSFTVNSGTQVTATVPAGAKTGKVAVKTIGRKRKQ